MTSAEDQIWIEKQALQCKDKLVKRSNKPCPNCGEVISTEMILDGRYMRCDDVKCSYCGEELWAYRKEWFKN